MKARPLICYVTRCTKVASVRGYNRVTHGLYCEDCAHKHERMNRAGFFPLLHFDLPDGGSWEAGLVVHRPLGAK